ncbi:endo-1,4-beta-xylanase B [Colletotrichum sublineola]|nr:endo-1,4-beta-xylanase B [Colletotrichum sublineola]
MMKQILALAAGFLLQGISAVPSEASNRISHGSPRGIVKRLDTAQITYFPAANSTGTGVLVCPGGAYAVIAIEKEGYAPAKFLNSLGIDAWVLDYTTASNATPPIYPKPQNEALDSLNYIRKENRTTKLGIWGFSAGGHLSAVTLTNPDARLDFGILAYPVITLGNYTNIQSRDNLIGADASPELQQELSAENRVSATTPPTFLFHTADDDVVPVQNVLLFAEAMAAHNRPTQLLILPDGPHGVGLALDDPKRNWTPELTRFLKYSI